MEISVKPLYVISTHCRYIHTKCIEKVHNIYIHMHLSITNIYFQYSDFKQYTFKPEHLNN